MIIERCGISSHHFGLLKIFTQSLKFWQTLFVVSMLVRYYHINQSINISHLQQTAVTRCQNLQLKCTKFCPSQERHPQGWIYGEGAGRTTALPSLSPSSSPSHCEGKKKKENVRQTGKRSRCNRSHG